MYVIRIWQGLGNQMFQYAFAKSLQEYTGKKVYLDSKHYYTSSLDKYGSPTKREMAIWNYRLSLEEIKPERLFWWKYINRNEWYHEINVKLNQYHLYPFSYICEKGLASQYHSEYFHAKNNTYFQGWFQNEKYFINNKKILKQEFIPQNKVFISHELQDILDSYTTVSIHVRRTDFMKYGIVLDESYYQCAIARIKNYVDNPFFIVFSDDINWVRNNLLFGEQVYFIDRMSNFKDYEELYLMSLCHHNIISNSTFSWWGAWLNENENKKVICPSTWGKTQLGIVPNEWEVI